MLGGVVVMVALSGCYKLEEGVGDRGFAPETSAEVAAHPGRPDARQPDVTTQASMESRAAADALARGGQAGGQAGASAETNQAAPSR